MKDSAKALEAEATKGGHGAEEVVVTGRIDQVLVMNALPGPTNCNVFHRGLFVQFHTSRVSLCGTNWLGGREAPSSGSD